jgi:hypothetical protein
MRYKLCSTAMATTIAEENTLTAFVFIFILKMEAKRFSVTFITTYGNNGLENHKNTADTDVI